MPSKLEIERSAAAPGAALEQESTGDVSAVAGGPMNPSCARGETGLPTAGSGRSKGTGADNGSARDSVASTECCAASGGEAVTGRGGGSDLSGTWLRIGLSLVFAGQGMMFGIGLNIAEEKPAPFSPPYWVIHGALMLSALIPLLLLGGSLVRNLAGALRRRLVTIESLFALSILGAVGGSALATFSGSGSVYYEIVGIVLVIHRFGELISRRSREEVLRQAEALREQFDQAFVRGAKGERRVVPIELLRAGESIISVMPGEPIPVDGVIVAGRSDVRQESLTGEPLPVPRGVGERVLAGSYAVDGWLEIRAEALAGERELDRVLASVEQARLRPSRLQEQADAIVRWFVPLVTGISASTFLFWFLWPGGSLWEALFNSMAVLLVACPCALGLATPVAVWGGLQRLAEMGITPRSGTLIDALSRATHVLFDKTGTLTLSNLTVSGWSLAPGWRFAERRENLEALVAAAEAEIDHPVARAIREHVGGSPVSGFRRTSLEVLPGEGLRAGVGTPGGEAIELRIGAIDRLSDGSGGAGWAALESGLPEGKRRVGIRVGGHPAAVLAVGEKLRPEAESALAALRERGLELEVLTGDSGPVHTRLDGVVFRTGLTTAQKEDRVAQLQAGGATVLMIGDGINDAGALQAADGGLAVESGSALSVSAAAGVLAGGNLDRLAEAVDFTRNLRRKLRGNMLFALFYNAVGISLAVAGILHPVVAALLMVGSSLLVSARALRSVQAPVRGIATRISCKDSATTPGARTARLEGS